MLQEKILYPEVMPKGQIKIELFDELTGKKMKEVNTHNFISKGVSAYLFRLAIKSIFTQNKATGGRTLFNDIGDPFRVIELTNATHPEEPENEWILKGDTIGWAFTNGTYSGSDKQRGTYNTAESYTELDRVRMVFDFPSHCANGEFQSIYFRDENPLSLSFSPRPFLNKGSGVLHAKVHDGEIWVLHSSSSVGGSSSNSSSSISRYDMNFNLIDTYTLPYGAYDFEIVDNHIYFALGTSQTSNNRGQIVRAPISDITNWTAMITGKLNENEDVGGIVFDEQNNQFIVSSSSGSGSGSSSSSISRYDTAFNLISTKNYTFPGGVYYYQKLVNDDGNILVCGNDRSYLLSDDDTATNNACIGLVMGVIGDKKVMRDGSILPKIGISSRALLDEPIVKTSDYTMKITYDFILE